MVKLLEEYAEDEKHMPAETLKNKWSIMKGHIGSVARYLTSHEVYLFWEAFDRYYGICQLDGFFGYRNVVLDAVKVQSYGYRFQNMKFKEEILSVEEQAKLFDWVELMVYREMPQEYEKFLYNFLLMYGVRKSFPEDSVSLFHFIKEDVGESERNRLYREYFSTDEWEAFRKKENERREQIKKERRQEDGRPWNQKGLRPDQGITDYREQETECYENITGRNMLCHCGLSGEDSSCDGGERQADGAVRKASEGAFNSGNPRYDDRAVRERAWTECAGDHWGGGNRGVLRQKDIFDLQG